MGLFLQLDARGDILDGNTGLGEGIPDFQKSFERDVGICFQFEFSPWVFLLIGGEVGLQQAVGNHQRIERDKGGYRKPRVVKNRSSFQPSSDASKHRNLGFLHADCYFQRRNMDQFDLEWNRAMISAFGGLFVLKDQPNF